MRWLAIGAGMIAFSLVVAVARIELGDRVYRYELRVRAERWAVTKAEALQAQAEADARAAEHRGELAESVRQSARAEARGRIAAHHRALLDKYQAALLSPWVPLPPDPPGPEVPLGTMPQRIAQTGRGTGAGR